MILDLSVIADDSRNEEKIAKELTEAVEGFREVRVHAGVRDTLGQIVFVQSSRKSEEFLESLNKAGNRKGKAIFLIVDENSAKGMPEELTQGWVDDVLVQPFRSLEVLSKIQHYEQILMWDEVQQMNASFSEIIEQLKGDFKLAERLQKTNLPVRFPDVKGMKISQRYLAGVRSGGDHFDLAESKDGSQLSLVLSDSSSYGLSSSVLSVLMKVAMKLTVEEGKSSAQTVRLIQEELKATLSEKDRLSLFYGVVSRKDYRLKYLNLGSSAAFYAPPGKPFKALQSQGEQITAHTVESQSTGENEIVLEPAGRFALISDGFTDAVGGVEKVEALLTEFREKDSKDVLNEMVFAVKKLFVDEDDMPVQDCTGIVFDLDPRLIRLA